MSGRSTDERPIRLAGEADGAALDGLAEALCALPLLQRYGVTSDGLRSELRRLVAANSDPKLGQRLLVAESAATPGELIGLARVLLRGDGGQFGRGGYLQLIALRPGCEGQGLGQRLLAAVEEQVAIASSDLFLLTSDFNHGAQRFYARAGYRRVGELPDFVCSGVAEIIYWKRLR